MLTQEGAVNGEAVAPASDAGPLVVMDKCLPREHLRLKRTLSV